MVGDLISRDDALRVFYNKEPMVQGEHDGMGMLAHALWRHIREAVEAIPSVEAEPVVHAHWVSEIVKKCDWKGQKRDYYQPYSCPVCHTPDPRKGESKYCSECGAHMDEPLLEERKGF